MATHYTAVIEITETQHSPGAARRPGMVDAQPESRAVVEVARVVIRADSLAGLTLRAKAHLGLISEGEGAL